jgi:hypothetical protein
MKYIKNFNESKSYQEPHSLYFGEDKTKGNSFEEGKGKYAKANFFADKLKDGFAINVSKENVDNFFTILKDITWIDLPKSSDHYTSDRYYFVLFGNRLLHSDKPYFGGNELEVYTPSL